MVHFKRVLTTEREYLKPAFTWNAHSMKINDMFVSQISDRVVSVSSDQTCKVGVLHFFNSTIPVALWLFPKGLELC